MKKITLSIAVLSLIGLATMGFRSIAPIPSVQTPPPTIPAGTYQLDKAHSSVTFSVTHMMLSKVQGTFGDVDATIKVGAKGIHELFTEASIKTASINTYNESRDNHLRSPDFFDAEKFPTITFKSKSITAAGVNLTIKGDLTMHGVTKPVTLRGKYLGTRKTQQGNKIAFEATGTINRQQFGMTWSKTMDGGGLVVSDNVQITLNIQANG